MVKLSFVDTKTGEHGEFSCEAVVFAGTLDPSDRSLPHVVRKDDCKLVGGVFGDATSDEVMALSTTVSSAVVEMLEDFDVSRDDVCRALIADLRRIRSRERPLGPTRVIEGDGSGKGK